MAHRKKQRIDIYQTVTDTIIAALERGLEGESDLPWHKCTELPQNANTGNLYRGVNTLLLWAYQMNAGFKSGRWATYKQWSDIGAQVKKGQKGALIVYWGSYEVEPTSDHEESETRMFAKYSKVFNADQVEGYELPKSRGICKIDIIEAADEMLNKSGADIRHEELKAYYNVSQDFINLPPFEFFKDANAGTATQNYYSVAFHELTHWTGASHRLNREMQNRFNDPKYAFEEIVAEMGAAMCCVICGVSSTVREDHVQYIQNWLAALKSDKSFIFSASSQAQKAVDYILAVQEEMQEAA